MKNQKVTHITVIGSSAVIDKVKVDPNEPKDGANPNRVGGFAAMIENEDGQRHLEKGAITKAGPNLITLAGIYRAIRMLQREGVPIVIHTKNEVVLKWLARLKNTEEGVVFNDEGMNRANWLANKVWLNLNRTKNKANSLGSTLKFVKLGDEEGYIKTLQKHAIHQRLSLS